MVKPTNSNVTTVAPYDVMATYYRDMLSYVDYDSWFSYLDTLTNRHTFNMNRVLDISCGMGKYVRHLRAQNIDAYGSDISAPFIEEAKREAGEDDRNRYFVDDMRKTAHPARYTHIVSLHDSVNYLTTPEELRSFLENTHTLLEPGCTLLFDLSTEHNVKKYFNDTVISDDIGETSYFWRSTYDEDTKIVLSEIDFIEKSKRGDTYSIKRETHTQRIWDYYEIESQANDLYEIIGYYDAFTTEQPTAKTEGENYILRRRT